MQKLSVASSTVRRGSGAIGHQVSLVHRSAASRMTNAPGMTRANVNPKNDVTCVISGTPPARPSLGSPILFGLAFYRWRGRVLDLEPVIDAAGAIMRSEPLRDDALAAERARMAEDARAVAVEVLIEGDAIANVSEEIGERCLAIFQRLPAKVLAVEFDEIESA